MLTILHAADIHLDSPFSGLPPEKAAQRRAEQRALLTRLADLAHARQADLVLLSGDLFDTRQLYRESAQALMRELGRIPCPVFIAPGNHDFYSPQSPYSALTWPQGVHIFRCDAIQSIPLPALNCTVHGAAFTAPRQQVSPLTGFQAAHDGQIHIMALHGEVDGGDFYGPISRDDIARSGLDYLALGHVHQCSGLQRAGKTWWAYPGCCEGRGFDETGDKGVLCITLDGAAAEATLLPLAGRRYEICTVDLTGRDNAQSAIRSALPEGTAEDIYRIVLTGEYPDLSLNELERVFAPLFYSLTLRDKTRAPRDRRASADTLTGLFLQQLAEAPQEQEEIFSLALRFGLAALEQGEDVSP